MTTNEPASTRTLPKEFLSIKQSGMDAAKLDANKSAIAAPKTASPTNHNLWRMFF